eukprot:2213049-Pyramimonas_sp.AAC.1
MYGRGVPREPQLPIVVTLTTRPRGQGYFLLGIEVVVMGIGVDGIGISVDVIAIGVDGIGNVLPKRNVSLTLRAHGGSRDERDAQRHARVVDQVPRARVVGAVDRHVVPRQDLQRVLLRSADGSVQYGSV